MKKYKSVTTTVLCATFKEPERNVVLHPEEETFLDENNSMVKVWIAKRYIEEVPQEAIAPAVEPKKGKLSFEATEEK